MSRYIIKQKLKSLFSFLIILILFPYIVSVFVNGTQTRLGSAENAPYVTVKTERDDGDEEVSEVKWTEYLAGISV